MLTFCLLYFNNHNNKPNRDLFLNKTKSGLFKFTKSKNFVTEKNTFLQKHNWECSLIVQECYVVGDKIRVM